MVLVVVAVAVLVLLVERELAAWVTTAAQEILLGLVLAEVAVALEALVLMLPLTGVVLVVRAVQVQVVH